MKLSISNIAWKNEEENELFPKLKRMGVDGIEVAITKYWPNPLSVTKGEIDLLKQYFTKSGFEIPAAQALLFGHPELSLFETTEIRNQTLIYLVEICKICAQLGAKVLVFGSPKNRLRGKLTKDDAFDIAVEFFLNAAKRISSTGAIICIEANPAEYNCDFIQTTQEGLDLVKSINHPNFRLNIDTSTMIINNESIYDTITTCIPWAAHIHISEPYLLPINIGYTFYKEFAKGLKETNYNSWLSLEMKTGLFSSSIQNISSSIKYITQIYFIHDKYTHLQ